MKTYLCTLLLLTAGAATAQKTVTVKKGEIKVNGEVAATYNGKGGNAFRLGEFTVTIAGQDTACMKLEEDTWYFKNPVFDAAHNYYAIKAGGQTFYYRSAPETKKFFGNTVVVHPRLKGSDIIDALFNDTMPAFIANKTLNLEAMKAWFEKNGYPREKIMAEVKEAEDAIQSIAATNVARDTKTPLFFNLQKTTEADLGNWYAITQGGQVIGRLYKRIGNEAYYEVWKKAPAGFMLQGKAAEFAPIVITGNLNSGSWQFDKKMEAIKVAGKEKITFICGNPSGAENDLVNHLIAAGML
jgi:hypothetical protein